MIEPQSPEFHVSRNYLDWLTILPWGVFTKDSYDIKRAQRILNRDHHEVYFAGTPKRPDGTKLRRHGDQMQRLPGGYYRAHGRVDDTMNLGGINISSAEVERVLNSVDGIRETAAISVASSDGALERLVVYAVLDPHGESNERRLKVTLQHVIAGRLNSLFRIHDVLIIDVLPRTASNKVMRRELRRDYMTASGSMGGGPAGANPDCS